MSKIVLCADDSVTMQTVAEMTLRASPYEYVGAKSADEALEKARASKPALILIDAVMPGKTGYELCAELKSDPQFKEIPVLMLCGNSEAYDAARGSEAGASGHITKPWDSQILIDKLGEILGGAVEAPAPAKEVASPAKVAAVASRSRSKDIRNATIMGMPAVSLSPTGEPIVADPAPVAQPVAAAKPPAAARPVATSPAARAPTPAPTPAPVATQPASGSGRHVAPPSDLEISVETPVPAVAAQAAKSAREPMIQAQATRTPSSGRKVRPASIPVAAAKIAEEAGLDPNGEQMATLLKLSQAVVERIVWEIVPDLAETIIREHVQRLSARQ